MNDERLILYFYDDGLTDAGKREIRLALERDANLATRYRELTGMLQGFDEDTVPAAPDDLKQRLHATVDRAAALERGRRHMPRGGHWLSFLLGVAATAAIAFVIVPALRQPGLPEPLPVDTTAATTVTPAGDQGMFVRAMQVYFRDSQVELQGLPDAGNGERTTMIVELINQNRSFARLAVENESPELARVLRAFEPILVRLAAEDITAEESAALRDKLAFELNVMLTKLTREASEFATSTEQESST